MSYVEIETGRYVKRWAFWNPATWSIPKLYWDAWSQEQRIHAICRQLEKVIKYADYLGVNVDDIAARLKAIEEGQLDEFIVAAIEAWFEENQPEIAQAIEDLQTDVANIELEIGSGFDAENTIANALATANAAIEAEAEARTNQDTVLGKKANVLEISQDNLLRQTYLGRIAYNIDPIYDGYHSAQSMCLLDDSVCLVALSNSTDNNNCMIVKINLASGVIIDRIITQFSHCNGLCYNPETDKVYVAPCYDYYNGGVSVNELYICDPVTLSIEQIVPFDFQPHGIGYDKVTGKMYMTSEGELGGTYVYSFDYSDNTVTKLGLVPVPTLNNFKYSETIGYQDIRAYNGNLYYVMGGNWNDILVVFDEECNLIKYMNLDKNIFIYNSSELEDIDFTTSGDIVTFSRCSTVAYGGYGVIGLINISGKYVYDMKNADPYGATSDTGHCDATVSDDFIRPEGSNTLPFKFIQEALALAILTHSNYVSMDSAGTYRLYSRDMNLLGNVAITGDSNANRIVEVPANTFMRNDIFLIGCGLRAYGSGTNLLRLGHNVVKLDSVSILRGTETNFVLANYGVMLATNCTADEALAVNCNNQGNVLSRNNTNFTIQYPLSWA